VHPLNEIELIVPPPTFLTRARVEAGGFLGVRLSDDEPVEPVNGLALILRRLELAGVEAEGVVRAARVSLIWSIEESPGPPKAPVD
jgi:hypothetical protein